MDFRLRNFINTSGQENSQIGLIEFPSDQGVYNNGGRQGSAQAPELIKARLSNMTPHSAHYKKHTELLKRVSDQGRIEITGDVAADQEQLSKRVADLLQKNRLPLIIGGGHETSYGHFLGYVDADRDVSIINIDAHTDVRELKDGKPHSGSPFYQALTHPSERCIAYHVFGLKATSVSPEHFDFADRHGSAHFLEDTSVEKVVNCLNHIEHDVMVTMDIDVVIQSEAPGVSAPNASGMRSEQWLQLAFEFGRHTKVTSFDLCEVNPLYDVDDRTVRLAAHTIWNFLLGVSLRNSG